jgi:CRISPR-associated exonuclease Cas4
LIFHAKSQQRTLVEMNDFLRAETRAAIAQLRALLESRTVPPPVLKPQCEGCSLHEICLPELSRSRHSSQLFTV